MRRSKLIKNPDNQIYFTIFVALLWSREILLEFCRGAMLQLPLISAASDYLIPALMFIMFLMSSKPIIDRLVGVDFVFAVVCIAVYIGEYLIFKRNRIFYPDYFGEFLLGCLPFYFVGVALLRDNDGEIIQWLYKISCLSVLSFAVYSLFFDTMTGKILRGGDMDSAYDLLPHACLTFYFMIKNFHWQRLAIFVIAALSILLLGTRGALLCLLIFIVATTAITVRFKRPIAMLAMVTVVLLFVLFKPLTDGLIELAYNIAEKVGMSTRIFDKFLAGEFTVSMARENLKAKVHLYLDNYPIIGLGVYGDRYVARGQYVHNLILEILAHFGYPIGTILLIAIFVVGYRGIRYAFKSDNDNAKLIILLLMSCCFKLLVSSSYLREPFFWLSIGYFVALIRKKRLEDQPRHRTLRESKFIK